LKLDGGQSCLAWCQIELTLKPNAVTGESKFMIVRERLIKRQGHKTVPFAMGLNQASV